MSSAVNFLFPCGVREGPPRTLSVLKYAVCSQPEQIRSFGSASAPSRGNRKKREKIQLRNSCED